jgi:signal transduction histidine kinase
MNGEAVRSGAGTRRRGIAARLALTVMPMVVVTLLVGALYIWGLITGESVTRFAPADVWAWIVGGVVVVATIVTPIAIYRVGRSASRRVTAVSDAAIRIADREVVNLLDVRGTIDPDIQAIRPLGLDTGIDDEIGAMARSLEHLRATVADAATRHVFNLRSSVSSVLVTLARRNTTLVDRQLAILDELEAREEDPVTLGGFFKVDHLAARMRRNAESLLILAGAESPRLWSKSTEMVDVVRAAVSEVDEYQRVEVLALEPARLAGGAATDIAHLLAELIDNAIQFSPPNEPVRVTGLFNFGGYQLTVSDRGLGMTDDRIGQLNRILAKPPALGFAVEKTLGLRVVAKLADRHGLSVELIPGAPGTTSQVTIPRTRLDGSGNAERDHGESQPAASRTAFRYAGKYAPKRPELPVLSPSGASEEVIDLTTSDMVEPSEPANPLTVRTPGSTLSEHEAAAKAVGEGTAEIRSALSAFDQGRQAAEEERDEE